MKHTHTLKVEWTQTTVCSRATFYLKGVIYQYQINTGYRRTIPAIIQYSPQGKAKWEREYDPMEWNRAPV